MAEYSFSEGQAFEAWADIVREKYGEGAQLLELVAVVGLSTGTAIYCKVQKKGCTFWASPYYNPAAGDVCCKWELERAAEDGEVNPTDWDYITESFRYWTGSAPESIAEAVRFGCPCEQCEVERDPEAWLDGMAGATDWENGRWIEEETLPTVF